MAHRLLFGVSQVNEIATTMDCHSVLDSQPKGWMSWSEPPLGGPHNPSKGLKFLEHVSSGGGGAANAMRQGAGATPPLSRAIASAEGMWHPPAAWWHWAILAV